MSDENRETALNQHKARHLVYWQQHGNPKLEIYRYEDGFRSGWFDGGDKIFGDEKFQMRRGFHIDQRGNSDHVWEWEHGYRAGQKSRKHVDEGGDPAWTPPHGGN